MSIYIVAAAMVGLLAISALAIDLVSFYAARAEAQRAADAAALAGANVFLTSGCTSSSGGCVSGGSQEAPAKQAAIDAGAQNMVAGQPANIVGSSDVSFNYPSAEEPQITVTVQRTAARGNALPTFFAKILGFQTQDVSATATAEAFNPSGSGSPIGASCLKPWILPNCDDDHPNPNTTNPNCVDPNGTKVDPFIDPSSGAIVHPGPVSSGGVIGETLVIKPGSPSQAPAPSKFYPVQLPPAPNSPSICPSCTIGSSGGGGALYRQNIECCNENTFVCGNVAVNFEQGNVQGPTQQGVKCLIHEGNSGTGQDILVNALPLSITGGSNNPNPALQGATGLTSCDSIVNVPLYDGSNLCPGNSCGPSVQIIGFLQVFISSVDAQGNVTVTPLNVAGCGSSGSSGGSTNPPASSGGAFVPIRLVHN